MLSVKILKISAVLFFALIFNGCSFIVAEENEKKFYGIDEKRGDEFLNQILSIQEQIYETKQKKAPQALGPS